MTWDLLMMNKEILKNRRSLFCVDIFLRKYAIHKTQDSKNSGFLRNIPGTFREHSFRYKKLTNPRNNI